MQKLGSLTLLFSFFLLTACTQETNGEIQAEQKDEREAIVQNETEQSKEVAEEKPLAIKKITPLEMIETYNSSAKLTETTLLSSNFIKDVEPFMKLEEISSGEERLPDELLPEVRLEILEDSKEKVTIKTIEMADEAYKHGRHITLTALYNEEQGNWVLDDLIVEEVKKGFPLKLTWDEAVKYAKYKGMEIEKIKEKTDAGPLSFVFKVLSNSKEQMFAGAEHLEINTDNGLITLPEEYNKVEEEPEEEAIINEPESKDVPDQKDVPVKTGEGDWNGYWADASGTSFLNITNYKNNSASVTYSFCFTDSCTQIGDTGEHVVKFVNNQARIKYEDEGWGNPGEVEIQLGEGVIHTTLYTYNKEFKDTLKKDEELNE
ncbi:hypothetical protein GKZ89_14045 [Bacillus mangrovi]|uniref:Lipoprotein n=1 Tax=Metabacillus mangrovi TaxID=1491830 RepID=A0A7X2V582_9BACI|nr:hypothetical protein [Metabacillus mangrovi]MTH54522.1 hypothetical protein [Metabacillus mangrovi]